jgi:hypothetical protein
LNLLQILVGELKGKIGDVEHGLGRLLLARGRRRARALALSLTKETKNEQTNQQKTKTKEERKIFFLTSLALTARARLARLGSLKLISQLALGVAAVILNKSTNKKDQNQKHQKSKTTPQKHIDKFESKR